MANDNTLGAPTEGLGQTVTFAANGGPGTPQASASNRQALRLGQQGGGAQLTARAMQVPKGEPDATMAVLMRLGGEAIKPHLEAERTKAYVSGMQQAAQGQAITEIVDEQPWYSKLFGSTSLVDGARAYTANAKASSLAVDIESNMPKLRELGSEEFSKYAAEAMTRANTGDPATDMMVMQQMASTLPAVLKGQAKEHLRFQQEQLEKSIKSSATSAFAYLGAVGAESRKPGSTKESADVLGAAINTIDLFTPPAGMLPELHDKYLAEAAVQSISSGNFDTYTLLKDSGKLDKLDPTAAYHVQRAYTYASQVAKLNVKDDLLVKLDDFRAISTHTGASREDVLAAAEEINKAYTLATGDPSQYVSNATTLQELEQLRNHQNQEQARLNNARATAIGKEAKALAEVAAISNLASRVVGGDGSVPYLMAGETKAEKKEVWDHLRATASPEVRLNVMVHQAAVAIDDTEKNIIEAAISNAKTTADPALLHKVYMTKYLPLVLAAGDNQEYVAQQYAGAYAEDMHRYHELAQGKEVSASNQAAYYQEIVTPRPKPLAATKQNKELVNALTTGFVMSHLPFTKTPIRDPEGYAAELAPKVKSYLSTDDAIKDAEIASPTLNLQGGYHWRTSTRATKLMNWVAANKTVGGVAPNNLDEALSITVDKYKAEAGIEGEAQLGQTTDNANGEPVLYIKGMGSDGKPRILPFPASDLNKVWATGQGRFDSSDLRFGPKLTFVPPDDMPSPYDSDEKWLAYRKRQALRKEANINKVRKQ